jgi:iron complex outermembrane receptor protein
MSRSAPRRLLAPAAAIVAALWCVLPPPLAAQASVHVTGMVLDAAGGQSVAGARVRLLDGGAAVQTGADGAFRLGPLPEGVYTLLVQRIGYLPARQAVRAGGTASPVAIRLVPSALEVPAVVVTGGAGERAADQAVRPTTALDGAALRRRLGGSVAATLSAEPGISQRYNGPAAAQPVVRGLGGDRVLMLEDGFRTGDVATTAADHAVTIDPLSAERIEVVRGPAGLVYGASTIGGVINVVREEIPRARPERIRGTATFQAESVNRGATAGASVLAPLGPLALRAEYVGRTAGDTRTPLGMLPFTDLDGYTAGAGASWTGSAGYAGISVRDYASFYGVPGTFNGRTIPGAHDGGVYVDLRRASGRLAAARTRPTGPFTSLRVDAGYSWYRHEEFEQGGIVGTRFGQLLGTAQATARYRRGGALAAEGAAGISGSWRDFAAAGSYTGSRPAVQTTLGAFAWEEWVLDPVRLQAGVRYDRSRVEPGDTTSSDLLQGVRTREFGALSASGAVLLALGRGWTAGASAARAFRTPAVEELYSNGPHLANYAYEVGNPSLEAEVATGVDLFVRVAGARLAGEAAVYRNDVRGFIRYAPEFDPATGRPRKDPRLRRYDVYRAAQTDAVLSGAEGRVQWEPLRGLVLEAGGSYTRGTDRGTGDPLPFMPPLQGRLEARVELTRWFAGLSAEGAARQGRVPSAPPATACGDDLYDDCGLLPGEFGATAGRMLASATAGVRLPLLGRLHTLTLQAENLFDAAWRDPLSRIKTVAPQPGRNLRLLYRVEL